MECVVERKIKFVEMEIADQSLNYVFGSIIISLLFLFTLLIVVYYFQHKTYKVQMKEKEVEIEMQQKLVASIINTQEQERIRIARDLHDDVASKLNSIVWSLHAIKKTEEPNSAASIGLNNSLKICTILQESIKRITNNLIPLSIENFGLNFVLKELCVHSKHKINYKNEGEQKTFSSFSLEEQTHLLRIIQELINNSIKHGHATESTFVFNIEKNLFHFSYSDNGIGCPAELLKNSIGMGIRNIILRSNILNGNFIFNSKPNNGFNFTLAIQR